MAGVPAGPPQDSSGRGDNVHVVATDTRNVGASCAAGFTRARSCGITPEDSRVWYATTNADSRVDPDWLARQIEADADMVLGVVRVAHWHRLPEPAVRQYLNAYHCKPASTGSDHGHIHGAHMGLAADAYWRAGGFAPLASGEDVDLVRRFEERGYRIRHDRQLSVVTSARHAGRAPQDFAWHLRSVLRRTAEDPA